VAAVAERPVAQHESADILLLARHLRARPEEATRLAEIVTEPLLMGQMVKAARSLSRYVGNRTRVPTFERLRAGSCMLARASTPASVFAWSASGSVAALHSMEVTT
jgi:hypothetical protein